MELAFTLDSAR